MSMGKDHRRFILCLVCGRAWTPRMIGKRCTCGADLKGKNVLKRYPPKGPAPGKVGR